MDSVARCSASPFFPGTFTNRVSFSRQNWIHSVSVDDDYSFLFCCRGFGLGVGEIHSWIPEIPSLLRHGPEVFPQPGYDTVLWAPSFHLDPLSYSTKIFMQLIIMLITPAIPLESGEWPNCYTTVV